MFKRIKKWWNCIQWCKWFGHKWQFTAGADLGKKDIVITTARICVRKNCGLIQVRDIK